MTEPSDNDLDVRDSAKAVELSSAGSMGEHVVRGPNADAVSCPHCQRDVELVSLLESVVARRGGDLNLVALELLSQIRRHENGSVATESMRPIVSDRLEPVPGDLVRADRSPHHLPRRRAGFWGMLLGAIFAFPCAQLILWWVFSVDPFGLAEPISKRLPSVVPPVLRELPKEERPDGQVAAWKHDQTTSYRLTWGSSVKDGYA